MDKEHMAFECLDCKQINVFPKSKTMNCMYCNGPTRQVGTIKVYEERESKALPIGIMPKSIWDEMRREELGNAIARYFNAGMPIPVKWIEEWNER